MFWGLSKNIGGGFRVGVGGRIGGSRRRGPSQRELAIQEKAAFLDRTKSSFDALMQEYCMSHGYLVIAKDFPKLQEDCVTRIYDIVSEFYSAQRLVRDGGPLTAKRREKILESIYAMEEAVAEIQQRHPLYVEYVTYERYRSGALMPLVIAVLLALGSALFSSYKPLLFSIPFFLGGGVLLKMAIDQRKKALNTAIKVISDV